MHWVIFPLVTFQRIPKNAEVDMDEDKTEGVIAEVVDGNDGDRDEAMEGEGNETVVDYVVGRNKEVEQKEVNGVAAVEKNYELEDMDSDKAEKISEEECQADHSC